LEVVAALQPPVLALHSLAFCTLQVLQALPPFLLVEAHPLLVGPQLVMALAAGELSVEGVARSPLGLAAMALVALFIWSGNL
jgi:hypothetical protein